MAHNKLYRNFIILQEDENSHSGSEEKPLSGYAKIEAKSDKCKISFYAQNLKKAEKYSMLLICYRKEMKQIVDLGFLEVNEVGKGEAVKEYYINNIAGLNFSYEKISGAAICKHKNEELAYLMYGFMNNENIKDDWKKCKIIKCADKDNSEYKIEKTIKKEEKKTDKYIKIDNDKKECKDDKDHDHDKHDYDDHKHEDHDKHDHDDHKHEDHDKHDHDDHKHEDYDKHDHDDHDDKCDDKKEHKEKDDKSCEGKNDDAHYEKKKEEYHKHNEGYECDVNCKRGEEKSEDNISREKFEEYEEAIKKAKENEEIDPYDFNLRGTVGSFFNNIVKGFEEVKDKFKEIKYCKWYKIKIGSIDDMCNTSDYNKYTVAYYPMLNYYPYIKKYGYFFMGYKCDAKGDLKYIVYGIPGIKDKDEQPYVGKTGFVTWVGSDDGKLGCWLMFYDYKNSNIVVPMK